MKKKRMVVLQSPKVLGAVYGLGSAVPILGEHARVAEYVAGESDGRRGWDSPQRAHMHLHVHTGMEHDHVQSHTDPPKDLRASV